MLPAAGSRYPPLGEKTVVTPGGKLYISGMKPPTSPRTDSNIVRLSHYVRDKTLQLFRYRVILIGVLAFFAPIWVMDQGQDLLVNSNSGDGGVFLFLLVVLVAAALNWYLAKLFFEKEYIGPVYPFLEPEIKDQGMLASEKKVSRMIGVCTILFPAVAILNALKAIGIPHPLDLLSPMTWLVLLLALFFVLVKFDVACRCYGWLEKKWDTTKAGRFTIGMIFLLGLILPTIIRVLIIRGSNNTPHSLFFLFCHLLMVALAFYIFVSTRNNIFSPDGWLGRKIGILIFIAAAILAVLFVLFNIFPQVVMAVKGPYLSLPVLLSGVIFYSFFITLLIRFGLWRKINYLLLIVLAGLIIAITAGNNYHTVHKISVATQPAPDTLQNYFHQWLLQRKDEIEHTTGTYPVFLVNTYGGGIRAAAFTNMVFSYLDSVQTRNGRNHKGFEHYVFSVSGASGGTVGAALQCAYRSAYGDADSLARAYSLDTFVQFYQHDFLTPVLSNMFGKDVWASATSLHLGNDRSEVQEALWEGFARRELQIDLGQPFDAIWDTSQRNPTRYEVPLLFSNTLNVDDGLKGICAPVVLNPGDFPATIFIRDRIDSVNAHRQKGQDSLQAVSLMTGAFLSARFPFISPSGKMGAGYHFMDGGGKDNSGASTSEDVFITLSRMAVKSREEGKDSVFNRLIGKVCFYFVSLSNAPYYNPDERRLVSNRFEPISPIVGIINSGIDGNARAADAKLRVRYAQDSILFRGIASDYCAIWPTARVIYDKDGKSFTPVLPLGWQISESSLLRLRGSFIKDTINSYNPTGIRKILKALANQ